NASRIVILTSSDQIGDIPRSRQLGIAAYLTKPVPQWELLETLHRVVTNGDGKARKDDAEPQPLAASATQPTAALKILVAGDNEYNQRLVMRLLEKKGHAVTLVGDGLSALAALDRGGFDIALLDLQMPGMDGLQVIAEWRRRESAGKRLPVVALTAHSMKGDR